jgi:hypothetical protein
MIPAQVMGKLSSSCQLILLLRCLICNSTQKMEGNNSSQSPSSLQNTRRYKSEDLTLEAFRWFESRGYQATVRIANRRTRAFLFVWQLRLRLACKGDRTSSYVTVCKAFEEFRAHKPHQRDMTIIASRCLNASISIMRVIWTTWIIIY